jgi:transcriptional regulator with XRE-family HTH domain
MLWYAARADDRHTKGRYVKLDSAKVRWHRDRLGWTLDTLAEQAEVAEGTALRAEHGEDIRPSSGRRIARAFGVDISELVPEQPGVVLPKAEAPSTSGRLEEKISDEERHARYLRAWRGFVWKLVHRWEADPPKTSREIAVILDTMQAIVDEGAFGLPPGQITTSDWREASEGIELQALFLGLQRLNRIADTVKDDETAQQRRELLKALPGGLSA